MNREKEMFPTFAKLSKRIPVSWYEHLGFILLAVLCGGLLLEQITVLYFGFRCFELVYTFAGIMMIVLDLLYFCFLLRSREHAIAKVFCIADWALMFFLVWCAISVCLSEDPVYCFVGSKYRKEGLATYFIYAGVVATSGMMHKQEFQRILLRIVAVSGFVLAVYAWAWEGRTVPESSIIAELHPGMLEIGGFTSVFHNSNHFGYYLTMAILIQAGMFLLEVQLLWRWMALGMFLVCFFVLLLNNTFGGFLAVTLGLLFLFVIVLYRDRRKCVGCALLAVCWLAMLLLSQIKDNTMGKNFSDLGAVVQGYSEIRSTASQRLDMWHHCLEQIWENPIFGTGLEGAGKVVFLTSLDRPHNEYLQHALFTGIPGLMAYLTALVFLLIRCVLRLKKLSAQGLILGAAIFGYCVSAFVGNTMYYTTIFYAMMLGLLIGSVRAQENPK